MDGVPDFTQWSEVDSYIHKHVRELRERVEALERERATLGQPRLLVNEGVACTKSSHFFPVGGGACLCGHYGGAA